MINAIYCCLHLKDAEFEGLKIKNISQGHKEESQDSSQIVLMRAWSLNCHNPFINPQLIHGGRK